MKKIVSMLIIFAFAVAVTGCGGGGTKPAAPGATPAAPAKVTLNLATPDPETSSITAAAKEYAKRVNEKSNGSIEIKVFPNGTLYGADPSAAVKQLGGGTLDMLVLSTSLYANFQPSFNMISIPYLFDNTDQFLKYLNDQPGQQLLGGLDKLKIKGLGLWTRSFRQITNSKRPIQTPEDLKGVKLRVPNNPLWVEFFKEAGAVPTPMAFGEVYNALQLNTIDGQENPVDIPMSAKFYEVQKYLSISNHMADAWVVGMNTAKFAKLTPDQQKLLTDTAKDVQGWKLAYDKQEDQKAIVFLKDKKVQVNELTSDQQKAFVAVSKKLYPKFITLVKDDAFFNLSLKFVGKDK